MQKTNILFVITKLELGGAQKQLLEILKALDKSTFNVFLFTACRGLLLDEACAIPSLTVIGSRFLERPINPFKDLCALLSLVRCIKKNRISLIHTHSSKAGIIGRFAAWLAGVGAVVHTVHGWSFNRFQPWYVRRFYIILERMAAAVTRRIAVCCLADQERGLACGIGSAAQYVLIRYGIDYASFKRPCPAAGKQIFPPHDGPVVGSIACLKPQKAPLDFIKVAQLVNARLPGTRFFLIGDGILRRQVRERIASFGLEASVKLLGWQRDIPAALSLCDVFILTSLWEGLPVTALEALAASKPVIATDTGGIREVVKDGINGFLVPAGQPQILADQLMRVLTDQALKDTLARNAAGSLGDDFRVEKMVRVWHDLYAALCYETQMD